MGKEKYIPTVLVTGANRGLGLEFARQYARDGWLVLACCRDPNSARDLLAVAEHARDRVRIFQLDVAKEADRHNLRAALDTSPVDVLLNNAGLRGRPGETHETVKETDWIQVFRVNVVGPLKLSAALANNVAASQKKTIAMITSKMGSTTLNQGGLDYSYRSTKAALNAVAKSLAIDLKARGIAVVAIHPGWVRTDMGAPEAPLSAAESVRAVRSVLETVGPRETGKFLAYDGSELPW